MSGPERSCATCEHFGNVDDYTAPFGQCTRTPATAHKNDLAYLVYERTGKWPVWTDGTWMLNAHPGVTAYTADASTYHSELYVHPGHYCSMWQEVVAS